MLDGDQALALVVLALARGLLDFIWAIRQMNYCLAAIGLNVHFGYTGLLNFGQSAFYRVALP